MFSGRTNVFPWSVLQFDIFLASLYNKTEKIPTSEPTKTKPKDTQTMGTSSLVSWCKQVKSRFFQSCWRQYHITIDSQNDIKYTSKIRLDARKKRIKFYKWPAWHSSEKVTPLPQKNSRWIGWAVSAAFLLQVIIFPDYAKINPSSSIFLVLYLCWFES